MEWVETTGRTVEEAKEAALDQLGVDENDAEFELVEEPRPGLFGRLRGQARVRARIRPTQPRPKHDRRDRRRRSRGGGGAEGGRSERSGGRGAGHAGDNDADASAGEPGTVVDGGAVGHQGTARTGAPSAGSRSRRRRSDGGGAGGARDEQRHERDDMAGEVTTVEEQAAMVVTFLDGLLAAFDLRGEVGQTRIDDDTIEVHVHGSDLGLLIGPKGQTLQAVQELARTYVQRRAPGGHEGRFRLDIGGYRERRREALSRFAAHVAEDVRTTGVAKALEPMNAADRKVVHDTVNELPGVSTTSEGEDPYRRVVIQPGADEPSPPTPTASEEPAPVSAGEDTAD